MSPAFALCNLKSIITAKQFAKYYNEAARKKGVTGTITSSDAKITATGGKFTAFTGTNTYAVAPATDKGSVTADILTEAGPALVGTGADTKLAPLGEVVLEYPTTESLV